MQIASRTFAQLNTSEDGRNGHRSQALLKILEMMMLTMMMMIVMVFCHKHSGNDEVDNIEEDDDGGDRLFLRSDPWMIDYQS